MAAERKGRVRERGSKRRKRRRGGRREERMQNLIDLVYQKIFNHQKYL